jgi:hypothetical protein
MFCGFRVATFAKNSKSIDAVCLLNVRYDRRCRPDKKGVTKRNLLLIFPMRPMPDRLNGKSGLKVGTEIRAPYLLAAFHPIIRLKKIKKNMIIRPS